MMSCLSEAVLMQSEALPACVFLVSPDHRGRVLTYYAHYGSGRCPPVSAPIPRCSQTRFAVDSYRCLDDVPKQEIHAT